MVVEDKTQMQADVVSIKIQHIIASQINSTVPEENKKKQ